MEKNIEKQVDSLLSHKAGVEDKKHFFKRTRRTFKLSPGVIALIITGLSVSAVLGGMFYSQMYVTFEGNVAVGGRTTTSVFSWDSQPIENGELVLPIEFTELNAGESWRFNHTITNEDMGDWLIGARLLIEDSQDYIINTNSPYYGITFAMCPDEFLMSPGESVDVSFYVNVSHEFMQPSLYGGVDNPLMTIEVSVMSVTPPVAVNDTSDGWLGLPNGADYRDYTVLANDHDFSGAGLDIISFEWVGAHGTINAEIIGTFPNEKIRVFNLWANQNFNVYWLKYTIEDGNGLQTSAYLKVFRYA
ncbi:MAG: hypothetical protein H7836_16545 [Magnetococcus sp. YQC-3]